MKGTLHHELDHLTFALNELLCDFEAVNQKGFFYRIQSQPFMKSN